MATKSKKKVKNLKKYYLFSEIMDSSCIPSDLKEALQREKSTYRRVTPSALFDLDKSSHKDLREIVKSNQTIKIPTPEGTFIEHELEMSAYDSDSWRYYLQPESLEDFEKFIDKLGIPIEIQTYDPSNPDHEAIEGWLEQNLGIPMPEEPFVAMQVMDAFLLDEQEECDCPSCRAERESQEDEDNS